MNATATPKNVKFPVVLLRKADNGKIELRKVFNEAGEIIPKGATPGYYIRRLMTVGEVAKAHGVSKNKAQELRNGKPLACLADFEGQEPLAEVLRVASI